MKHLLSVLPIVGIVFVFALSGCSSNRIEVANTGIDVVEIKSDSYENKVLLGQNGTGYFDRDSKIQIGDAMIKVGRCVEVVNTGSDIIQITYHNAAGSERTMLIGEGGTGYVSKSAPFKIGDANIRVSHVQ
jgi:hypothetical protein